MAEPDYNTEIWKTILDAPDYEVSSLGRVRRAVAGGSTSKVGHILKPSPTWKGYLQVSLRVAGKSRSFRVHRLVCRAFHGEPPEGKEAAHNDGDKLNNVPPNLRWATHRENIDDSMQHVSRQYAVGSRHQNSKLTEDAVREIRAAPTRKYVLIELGRKYGVSPATVERLRCRSSRTWRHVPWPD